MSRKESPRSWLALFLLLVLLAGLGAALLLAPAAAATGPC
jgi:hypothetical protein